MSDARAPAGATARKLGLFTVLCIGVNNIIGSGIYTKPSKIAAALGSCGWIAFLLCAVMLVFVALCFSAMARRHDETGGPYLYAREIFGPWAALAVAWTAWISMWAAAGGVAVALPDYLRVFFDGADGPIARRSIAIGLIALLCLVNCLGVKPAAGTATVLTIAKVVPLLLFALVGLFHVHWHDRVALAPPQWNATTRSGFSTALFAAFFALQGFEVVPVPAGELKNPRRDVPLSVTGSLLVSALLYCLIQIVAYGTHPEIAHTADGSIRPIADAAGTFLGEFGRNLMAVGAVVSLVGFAAVTILCAPRFLVPLVEDRLLPRFFARQSVSSKSPYVAIIATCVPAALGCFVASFDQLTALTNIAVLVQYVATCLAVIVVGRRGLLGRYVVPFLGLGACLFLAYLVSFDESPGMELLAFFAWLIPAFVLALFARSSRPA